MADERADFVVGSAVGSWPLSRLHTRRVVRRAAYHAQRTAAIRRLSSADRDDLRQDIALDILTRLSAFDPSRSSFETFVELVATRAAQSHGERAARARRAVQMTPIELIDPENSGEAFFMGDAGASAGACEQRLALKSLVRNIPEVLPLLLTVIRSPSDSASDLPPEQASRSTAWRRKRDLRCLLLLHGVERPP